MKDLDERLSALLSGDLPEAEARALRARVEAEPEVAARLRRLERTIAALEALPDALSPPPLRTTATPTRSSRWAPPAIAAAAAFAIGLAWPRAAPEILLVSGTEWVDGGARILAGDAVVDVSGRARVSVEPPPDLARGGGAEDGMDRRSVLAALAGAAVTVAVYEGRALLTPADAGAAPIEVVAGDTLRVGPTRAASRRGVAAGDEDPAAAVARLQGELAAAQQALATAEFEGALTRGQLQAMQGAPSEWPGDVPTGLRPDGFRAGFEASLAGVPNVEITEVDCSEYPCVGVVHYTGAPADGEDWEKPVQEAIRGWIDRDVGSDDVSMQVNGSRFRDDDGDERYMLFGIGAGTSDDVNTRTGFRIDSMVKDLGASLDGPPPDP